MKVYNRLFFFFFQAEDGIRDSSVTGVQTCALPICRPLDLATLLEVGPDDRDQPLRDAVRALGAQTGQRVADLRVREPLDELVLVGGEVDPGYVMQRRSRLSVHVREKV